MRREKLGAKNHNLQGKDLEKWCKKSVGVQSPKIQLVMGKTKAKISPKHENVWDLGREWEMKKNSWEKGMKVLISGHYQA